MFFFLFGSYNILLIAAAVIPAIVLLVKVYRSDRLEKEPPHLILSLVFSGILATLLAMLGEWVGSLFLKNMYNTALRDILL